MGKSGSQDRKSPSQLIDERITGLGDCNETNYDIMVMQKVMLRFLAAAVATTTATGNRDETLKRRCYPAQGFR
jgi:hypothetical protein